MAKLPTASELRAGLALSQVPQPFDAFIAGLGGADGRAALPAVRAYSDVRDAVSGIVSAATTDSVAASVIAAYEFAGDAAGLQPIVDGGATAIEAVDSAKDLTTEAIVTASEVAIIRSGLAAAMEQAGGTLVDLFGQSTAAVQDALHAATHTRTAERDRQQEVDTAPRWAKDIRQAALDAGEAVQATGATALQTAGTAMNDGSAVAIAALGAGTQVVAAFGADEMQRMSREAQAVGDYASGTFASFTGLVGQAAAALGMQAAPAPAEPAPQAHLDAAARSKAAAASVSVRPVAAAAQQSVGADGMTEGYQRRSKNGVPVTVKGYRTPNGRAGR